jgi:hypothetical protein
MSSRIHQPRPTIGWREWIELPLLGIPAIKAKIDTGARSSALHALDIEYANAQNGDRLVHFTVHPQQRSKNDEKRCTAVLLEERAVRNSGGTTTVRPVIRTTFSVGDAHWYIDLTLVSRSAMDFRLLLGREALRRRFVVDPARSYLFGTASTRNVAT